MRLQKLQAEQDLQSSSLIELRELGTEVAKLQRHQAEEETRALEDSARRASDLAALQESFRESSRRLADLRDEVATKAVFEELRTTMRKESLVHSSRCEGNDTALRELKAALLTEMQQRESMRRSFADALQEERLHAEDAIGKVKRGGEQEVKLALLDARRAREEDERHIQKQLIDLYETLALEREHRLEQLRQERQRAQDAFEELSRGQKLLHLQVSKGLQDMLAVEHFPARDKALALDNEHRLKASDAHQALDSMQTQIDDLLSRQQKHEDQSVTMFKQIMSTLGC